MIIYAAIIFGIFILALLQGKDDDIVEFFILLPIFGRLFGWW